MRSWGDASARRGSTARAVRHAVSGLCSIGRQTISRAIMGAGRGGTQLPGAYRGRFRRHEGEEDGQEDTRDKLAA